MRTTLNRRIWNVAATLGAVILAVSIARPSSADDPKEIAMNDQETLLFFRATPDPEQQESLGQYFQHALPLAAKAGAKDLLQRPVAEHLAGRLPAAIIAISQFPSEDAARGFFERSEDYQELIPIRDKAFKALDVFVAGPGEAMATVGKGTSLVAFVVAPNPEEKEALARYQKASQALADNAGVRLIVQRPVADQIIGSNAAAMLAVAEFSSREAVTAFFESDEYKALLPDRAKAFSAYDTYLLGGE